MVEYFPKNLYVNVSGEEKVIRKKVHLRVDVYDIITKRIEGAFYLPKEGRGRVDYSKLVEKLRDESTWNKPE